MVRAVVIIVLVATFLGAMMPSRPSAEPSSDNIAAPEPWFADASASAASSSSSSSSRRDLSGGDVRLDRHSNGHFYADVEINGTSVEFMIDTGATSIAMTEKDARRAGVQLDPSGKTYVGEGAGGSLSGHRVRLERVKLGDKAASGMDAVVIEGASTNLLGQSFLSQFREVTVRDDVMTLR